MKFNHPHLEREFKEGLDDEVRRVIEALDGWGIENKMPEVVLTQVLRSQDEQEDIYSRYAKGLIRKIQERERMTEKEKALALELSKLSPAAVNEWARHRFTWHMAGCAVDIRSRHYKVSELVRVMEFLNKRCPRPAWELLAHDITAPHVHVARKDLEKRAEIQ